MDPKEDIAPTAPVLANAVSEAAELLRGLVVALHNLTAPSPAAPMIEAAKEESALPPTLRGEEPSTLKRPYEQRPVTPTGPPSEEEEEEGAVGGMVQNPDNHTSGKGCRGNLSDVPSTYSPSVSHHSPPQGPGLRSTCQPLELRWNALERALQAARDATISARRAEADAFREWDEFHDSSRWAKEFSAPWAKEVARRR